MTKLLKVAKVSGLQQDKRAKDFKIINLETATHSYVPDSETGEMIKVRVPRLSGTITRWKESYLDNKMEYMYDAIEGEQVPGDIVTRKVHPYDIDDKTVITYTTPVLGMTNEPDFEAKIMQTFRQAGHQLPEDPYVADSSEHKANSTSESDSSSIDTPRVEASQDETDAVEETAEINDELEF
mgnify:CR=1 FL=1